MHSIIAGSLAALLVSTAAFADDAPAATGPTEKTTIIRGGHDIAPLPGGKVAPISQSDKDNVNKAVEYFEKKLKPSRRKKSKPAVEAPAAASTPTAE